MKRVLLLATLGVAVQAFLLGVLAAEENASQTKTGIVKKVDVSAGQVVVMVARELTFTVTESTEIVQGDESKELLDVKVGARVAVDYSREGDTRTAKKIAILAADVVGEPAAKEADPEIKPGSTFTIKFPDMPPTFADLLDHNGLMPMMTVSLPANYDPARKHPLLIFLSGGNGGSGGNPSVARALSEDKDFVCVNLPLFKERLEPPAPGNGTSRILIRDADCRYAWPFYKVMLARLEELVPNIDPAQRVLGGFSNGAHTTAGLINETDGEAAARFSAFFLVDGGGGLRRFDLLKGKPLLMVCGGWRPKQEPALAAGVRLIVYRMKKAEHAFPESEYPPVREWLRDPDSAKLVRASAEENVSQTKTGIVKQVDTSARQVIVLVSRELTFTVTESTEIVQGDESKELLDVKVGARVAVDYSREGDTRTAKTITILAADVVGKPAAKETDPEIKPGNTFTIKFPDMPPTFYSIHEGKDVQAQMTVFLPANYDLDQEFPLLIFLGGGNGGPGSNPGVARSLCDGKDFVCVGMPLFKAPDPKETKPNVSGAGFIMRAEDGRYMWPFFKAMLEKLEEVVSNIDPAHHVLGGFSNGAHATAGLIDESDGQVARRFSAFVFVEGGGKLQHYDLLKGKPFLMVSSNAKSEPRAQQICDAAKSAGAKAAIIVEDVGAHDFPVSAYPAVRSWLRGAAME